MRISPTLELVFVTLPTCPVLNLLGALGGFRAGIMWTRDLTNISVRISRLVVFHSVIYFCTGMFQIKLYIYTV